MALGSGRLHLKEVEVEPKMLWEEQRQWAQISQELNPHFVKLQARHWTSEAEQRRRKLPGFQKGQWSLGNGRLSLKEKSVE